MKVLLALALFALLALVRGQKGEPLEDIDLENVLKNDKLVRRHIDCVLDKARCDKNGRDMKEILPKVINFNCSTCTSRQKSNADEIVDFMKEKHPSDWALIVAKYKI